MIDPSLRAIRLRQGRTWIAKLVDLENWPEDKCAATLAELEATRDPARLDALVERHRSHLWQLLTSRDLIEPYGGISDARRHGELPQASPPPLKPRGIARALKPKAKGRAKR